MERPRVYLDTSVPSAYFDERAPDRLALTRKFWSERLPRFGAVVSEAVLLEIRETPDVRRREQMLELVAQVPCLAITEEAEQLAQEYLQRGIFTERYDTDALHVALATVDSIGNLASWNFEHLVKVSTRREINLVNALKGYMPIEIVAPPEL